MPFLHDERFSEAFAVDPVGPVGKRLLPFSLWHQLLLEHAQSPVYDGRGCTPGDLLQAARLCSTPWNPAFEFPDMRAPGFIPLAWASLGCSFETELAKFGAYLTDYGTEPKLWTKSGDSEARDLDAILERATYLIRSTSLTWEQVWTAPSGVLAWVSVASQKLEGAEVDIWTPDDEVRFQAHVKKREARIDEAAKVLAAEKGVSFPEARKQAHAEYWAKHRESLERLKSTGNGTKPH